MFDLIQFPFAVGLFYISDTLPLNVLLKMIELITDDSNHDKWID